MERIDVLGVGFDNLTMAEAVAEGVRLMNSPGAHYIVTPNPEIVEICARDAEANSAINGADMVIADGVGIIHGAKLLGTPLKAKLPGIEFASELMGKMAEQSKSLFLFGAKPGIAESAAANLAKKYPGLKIAGVNDGYFEDDKPIIEKIKNSGADVVFVCLGAPKQEKWMEQNGEATGAHLLLGIGGSLDVFAGVVKRAPKIYQKLGMEWFYRLLKQPSRIGRMAKLPMFLVHAAAKGKTK